MKEKEREKIRTSSEKNLWMATVQDTLIDMMKDVRQGIWSELRNGKKIDRLGYLMIAKNQRVRTRQSDIRAIIRVELKSLRTQLYFAHGSDSLSRIHIADALERIDAILNPNG